LGKGGTRYWIQDTGYRIQVTGYWLARRSYEAREVAKVGYCLQVAGYKVRSSKNWKGNMISTYLNYWHYSVWNSLRGGGGIGDFA
jgi:hypothetical protein